MPDKNETATGALTNIGKATQQFISDVLTEKPDTIYDMDDYATIRKLTFDNVKNAVTRRFPLRNDRYTLSIENVDYDDPEDIDVDVQKRTLLDGGSSGRRLRGEWVLRDAKTDKVVSRTRRMTIMKVPRMTDRGTFIRNGKEFCLGNIMRLEPGVYCKRKDDEVSAQFNVKQGTGSGFNMIMNPKTGVFLIRQGTSNAPAYTVFRDMGITDDQLKEAWGNDIFETNRKYGTGDKARAAANKIYNS